VIRVLAVVVLCIVLYALLGFVITLWLAAHRPLDHIGDKDVALTWALWPVVAIMGVGSAIFVSPMEHLQRVNQRAIERKKEAARKPVTPEEEEGFAASLVPPKAKVPAAEVTATLAAYAEGDAEATRKVYEAFGMALRPGAPKPPVPRCMCGHARSRHKAVPGAGGSVKGKCGMSACVCHEYEWEGSVD
jgi:hypothetical protein